MDKDTQRIVVSLGLVLVPSYLFIQGSPPWDTPSAATVYYSVLALLCITMAASAVSRNRMEASPAYSMLVAGIVYAVVIFAGAAIFYKLIENETVIHVQTAGIFLNLVAFATTGLTMASFSRLEASPPKEGSLWYKSYPGPLIALAGVVFFGLMMVVSRQVLDQYAFLIPGYICGGIALVSYLFAGIQIIRQKRTPMSSEHRRLALAFFLLAAATVNHIVILPQPTSMWVLSVILLGLAFIYSNVGIGYTFLREIGVDDRTSYFVTILVSILVVVPFILSFLIEAIALVESIVSYGATLLIHALAAMLAGASAFAFHTRLKYRQYPGQLQIVFLLIFWAVAEFAIVFYGIFKGISLDAEWLVPYICGCIVSAVALSFAVRRTLKPSAPPERRTLYYFMVIVASILIIMIGEIIRPLVVQEGLGIAAGILGSAMIIGLGAISLYALLTFILVLIAAAGGELTYDSLGAGLAAIWVIVSILKANFKIWSIGWWSAEGLLLSSVVLFTLFLLRFYLKESQQSYDKQTDVISKFLEGALSARQTKVLDVLSELSMDSSISESGLKSVGSALAGVSRANELSRHLTQLVSGEPFPTETLGHMDFMDAFRTGLVRAGIMNEDAASLLKVGGETRSCTVFANELLVDAFHNIFEAISQRIGKTTLVSVGMEKREEETGAQCFSEVILEVFSEDPHSALALLKRYIVGASLDTAELAFARRVARLFHGDISWRAAVSSEKTLFVAFELRLLLVREE